MISKTGLVFALCVLSLCLSSCATLRQTTIQSGSDNEFQQKLDRDPRFQNLIDQIRVPVTWHPDASVDVVRDGHTGVVIGYKFLATLQGPW